MALAVDAKLTTDLQCLSLESDIKQNLAIAMVSASVVRTAGPYKAIFDSLLKAFDF